MFVAYGCTLTPKEDKNDNIATFSSYVVFIIVIFVFFTIWALHRRQLNLIRKKFYDKQVSVSSFSLKAPLDPQMWMFYELTAKMERKY